MARCVECAGCTKYVWVDGIRFLFCDFCGKYYNIVGNKLVETVPLSLRPPKKVDTYKKLVTYKKEFPLDRAGKA